VSSGKPPTTLTAPPVSSTGASPHPTPAGNQLRHAARLISVYGYLTQDRTFAPLKLIIQIAALAEAVAELREVQQRTHRADAALRAAVHLRTFGASARLSQVSPAAAGQPSAREFPNPPLVPGHQRAARLKRPGQVTP